MVTPGQSDTEENGEAFSDADFCDSDEGDPIRRSSNTLIPLTETTNGHIKMNGKHNGTNGDHDGKNGFCNGVGSDAGDGRRDSVVEQRSIVGFLGKEHDQAEQRLAARRAARAEARDIRMRELERQRQEQENHADKAYDMQNETLAATRRVSGVRAIASPRRSSEDSNEDGFGLKDLRLRKMYHRMTRRMAGFSNRALALLHPDNDSDHELKEVEEKFRKAMILNAQLDNDKASMGYQLELLKDRIEDLQEEHTQLQREHREKCSALERQRRDAENLAKELHDARRAIAARDRAIEGAGYKLVDAETTESRVDEDDIPLLAIVTAEHEQFLESAGEGSLDVRLQKLFSERQSLESDVRKLKIALNDAQSNLTNGLTNGQHDIYENEVEELRRTCAEHKAARARAEAESALAISASARLEAQLARLKSTIAKHDEEEEQLKQEKRRLTREVREALNRVEELETENGHLTKRLDKLKNAKSTLLKEL